MKACSDKIISKYVNYDFEIKIIYGLSYSILCYILWGTVTNVLFSITSDYRALITAIFCIIIREFISLNTNNKIIIITVPMIFPIVLLLILYFGIDNISSAIMVWFMLLTISGRKNSKMIYSDYIDYARTTIYILIGLGILLFYVDTNYRQYIVRSYFIYLASIICLLRKTRNYYNKISVKRGYIFNLGIVLFIFTMSVQPVYLLVLNLIKVILGTVLSTVEKILLIILWPLYGLMNILFNGLYGFISKLSNKLPKKVVDRLYNDNINKKAIHFQHYNDVTPAVETFIEIFIPVIIIVISYVIIRFVNYKIDLRNRRNDLDNDEVKEKIVHVKKIKKDHKFLLKDLFMKRDYSTKIRRKYQNFLKTAFKKEVFKVHMTGLDIINSTKSMPDNMEIQNITNIYNESKFSNHTIKKEVMNEFNNSFLKIRMK